MRTFLLTVFFISVFSISVKSQDSFDIGSIWGGKQLYIESESEGLNETQLIPVNTKEDIKKVVEYLATILVQKDMELLRGVTLLDDISIFLDLDSTQTAYVFITPKSNIAIANEPYVKKDTNAVFFKTETIEFDPYSFVSLYVFYVNRGKDFRVILHDNGKRLERGRYSLLPERFKKGKKYNKIHNSLWIIGYGEMFYEKYAMVSPDGREESAVLDFIAYTDSIRISLEARFGFRFEMLESDTLSEKELTFKYIHPEFKTGPYKGQTEYIDKRVCEPEKPDGMGWKFTDEYELVPGVWTFQLSDDKNILYEKKFYLLLDKTN